MKRKGCHRCGTFVIALDDARWRVRNAVARFTATADDVNRARAEKSRRDLELAKQNHDEHMAGHEREKATA